MPQRIGFVTLGARDVATLRAFYTALGWEERAGSNDGFAVFDAGTVRLALYPVGLVGEEAAPGEPLPGVGWNGVTLAVNVESTGAVDEAGRAAEAAGARVIAEPVAVPGGVYSGYVADRKATVGDRLEPSRLNLPTLVTVPWWAPHLLLPKRAFTLGRSCRSNACVRNPPPLPLPHGGKLGNLTCKCLSDPDGPSGSAEGGAVAGDR